MGKGEGSSKVPEATLTALETQAYTGFCSSERFLNHFEMHATVSFLSR